MRNIRQNLFFAFIYNAAGVPVAAGAMALSSVSVIGNAIRLRSVNCKDEGRAFAKAGAFLRVRF